MPEEDEVGVPQPPTEREALTERVRESVTRAHAAQDRAEELRRENVELHGQLRELDARLRDE